MSTAAGEGPRIVTAGPQGSTPEIAPEPPSSDGGVSDEVRQVIAESAARIDFETWVAHDGLRDTARRTAMILGPAQSQVVGLRYGFDGPPLKPFAISRQLGRNDKFASLSVHRARPLFLRAAPEIAAGTYDYVKAGLKSSLAYPGLLGRMGVYIPRKATPEELRALAKRELDATDIPSDIKQLLVERYGLGEDSNVASLEELERRLGVNSTPMDERLMAAARSLTRARVRTHPNTFTKLSEPTVDIATLEQLGVLTRSLPYIGGLAIAGDSGKKVDDHGSGGDVAGEAIDLDALGSGDNDSDADAKTPEDTPSGVNAGLEAAADALLTTADAKKVEPRSPAEIEEAEWAAVDASLKAAWVEAARVAARLAEEGGIVSEDVVKDYLRSIRVVPLLTAEQEVELAKRIEAGIFAGAALAALSDRKATPYLDSIEDMTPEQQRTLQRDLRSLIRIGERSNEHMMLANLRLVVDIAKRYTKRGMLFIDLIQEGNLGLDKAVEKFDYTKGYKFSTYATWWIRQSITRATANQGSEIRVPVHMVDNIDRLRRVGGELSKAFGRDPTPEELSKELHEPVETVLKWQGFIARMVSIDLQIGYDPGAATIGDVLIDEGETDVDEQVVQFALLQDRINSVLGTLTDREAEIIRMLYGINGVERTREEIAQHFGMPIGRTNHLISRTMSKLQHPSRSQALRDWLD